MLKWERKMKWQNHAGIHKECLSCTQLLEGSSTNGRVITPLLDKFISHYIKSCQPNWVPQQNSLPSTLLFIGTLGRLYLPGWRKKWMDFCWSGWILARKSKSITQRSVPNPALPLQQVRPASSPLWGFLQDNTPKIKGSKVWSQTESVKWAHKTGPKPLFSIFSVIKSDSPHRHKSLRGNYWRKVPATFFTTHSSALTLVPASSFIMKRESSALSSSSSS